MSERFVRGWKVSPKKLLGLVGSKRWSAKDVLKSRANAACRSDVFMTLGDGEEAEGKATSEELVGAILSGKLDRQGGYGYARVLELRLNHAARPLTRGPSSEILLQLTYAVPNDSHGRWNPILRALKMPKLAKAWASTNLAFPWSGSKGKVDWPVWTVLDDATLRAVAVELRGVTKARIDALPPKLLVEPSFDWLDDCRKELFDGLKRLAKWVDLARAPEKTEGPAWTKTGNALVLSMDGDQ